MKYPSPDELVAVRVDSKEYEDIFVDHLLNLYEHSNDKNKDWWPFLLENWDTRFERWYMTLHGKKIAYFSALQKMPWKTEQPYYRFMARTWSGFKKVTLESCTIPYEMSPSMLSFKLQLEDYPTKNRLMSMEYVNRRGYLTKFAQKLNGMFDHNWKLLDDVYFTCTDYPENKQKPECWQSIISEHDIPVDRMSVQEYINTFGNRKKYYGRK